MYGGQQDNTVYTRFGLASRVITERHEQEVQRYLNAYACGSLPKIPKDYAEDFPQGLARDKAVFLDAVTDHISAQTSSPATAPTQGDSKVSNDTPLVVKLCINVSGEF
ncbi:unnamed protein product [Dibothriocephalus latus]|uniref:Uncharacterized protein n=1 Tax=Dibothriocephalus latus TaxID=60516 RepID=A0A3P7QFH9_DIBLA|nr:unnamed protein product [Dibothriocephalus latus]